MFGKHAQYQISSKSFSSVRDETWKGRQMERHIISSMCSFYSLHTLNAWKYKQFTSHRGTNSIFQIEHLRPKNKI